MSGLIIVVAWNVVLPALFLAATIVALIKWLAYLEARALLDGCRPSSADVSMCEHELFAFDLGRTHPHRRTLAEKLAAYRNEIAA